MEYYVIGEDKSSAPAYKKDEVYNKAEINDKINDIDNSLNDKAAQSDVTALQATVADKLGKDALQAYVPKTTTINGQPLSSPVVLDYNSVGAAKAEHNHDTLYYPRADINSKIDDINSKIDKKANATHTHVQFFSNVTQNNSSSITLPKIDNAGGFGYVNVSNLGMGWFSGNVDVHIPSDGKYLIFEVGYNTSQGGDYEGRLLDKYFSNGATAYQLSVEEDFYITKFYCFYVRLE